MNGSDDAAEGPLHEAAEAVRAYLVGVRGGAPLLSGSDAHLLHSWLLRGVRSGAIVRGIELAAERRLAKRVRAPLSLVSCRAEVEKQQKHAGAWVRGGRFAPAGSASSAPGDARFAAVSALALAAERAIAALRVSSIEERGVAACLIAAAFWHDAWEVAPQDVLVGEAELRLADARALYDEAEWETAKEAFARDGLRQRYPKLTATWIWEEASLGVE